MDSLKLYSYKRNFANIDTHLGFILNEAVSLLYLIEVSQGSDAITRICRDIHNLLQENKICFDATFTPLNLYNLLNCFIQYPSRENFELIILKVY